jgi:mono/diheme cytochrome c family protein
LRRLFKFASWTVLIAAVVLSLGITFTIGWRPVIGPRMRPTTNRKFESTPERLARGKYIFKFVAGCEDCHSPHDTTKPGMPITDGAEASGEEFLIDGVPAKLFAPNLTPDPETGVATWTDDQLARAIREGVTREGRAMFPIMPYQNFHYMSDEDLASVVVYMRSLPAVKHALPESVVFAPVKYLIRDVPQPITAPVPPPDSSTAAARGNYLARLAACNECHTPAKRGAPIPGMNFAGGFLMSGPWGSVATANITPDPSGISYYDENLFREVMRTGMVRARKLNELMPYNQYKGLTDGDISDIFAFLKTLKPVSHRVDNTETPTMCKKCGFKHGLGEKN